jgi:DNA-binding transcriptional MerR regulator
MQIGEFARRSGASQKAVRLYDRLGLIVGASRSTSNYRLFDEDAGGCVRGIRALQAAGLTLRDMQNSAATRRRGPRRERCSRARRTRC